VRPVIGVAERERFARDGFLAVAQPVATADELDEICAIIEGLLPRAPVHHVKDLARGGPADGRILEIERTSDLDPALRRSPVYRRCRQLATQLVGVPMAPYFDHVICKPAENRSETAWHQDSAYAAIPGALVPPAAHVWLALQPATIDNGCMRFLPGTHRSPVAHRPRGGDPAADALEAIDVDASTAVACPLPAGGITIHHPGVLHHTGPNTTDEPRLAWILQFRREGAWGVRAMVPGPVRGIVRRRRER
jgi:hypothetical protein